MRVTEISMRFQFTLMRFLWPRTLRESCIRPNLYFPQGNARVTHRTSQAAAFCRDVPLQRPQPGDTRGDAPGRLVDLVVGGEPREAEAETGTGFVVTESEGQEDVAGPRALR